MQLHVPSVQRVRRRHTRLTWSILGLGTVMGASFGVLAAKMVRGGISALRPLNPPSMPGGIVVFLLLLIVPAVIRWPRAALIGLLAGTTLIDQFPVTIGPTTTGGPSSKVVANIPLFRSLTKGSFVTPAEVLLFVLVLVWLTKGARHHTWLVPRSPVAKAIAAFYAIALIVGVGLGVVHHGLVKEILWELRPWYYVAVMYLLTSSFFAGREVFRPLLWTLVLGSGIKSMEGVYYFFTVARTMRPRPEAVLGHEESFFFGLFLLATLALWLFQIRGRLRWVATAMAPVVLIADLGNSRRTAFLLVYAGMAALLVIAYVAMPERRHALKRMNAVLAVGAVVYLGIFWNHGGTLGQPARAVHSAVAPTARDLASDQYRVIENANLQLNIHLSRSIGRGFGTPILYAYSIVNLTGIDSSIAFIPHDGVLYVWYRLGIVGEAILWSIVGFGILAGCRLTRHRDREVAALGAIAVCALICYVLQGYNDLGFTWLRIAIFMGFMLGALEVTSQRAIGPRPERQRVSDRSDEPLVGPRPTAPNATPDAPAVIERV